MATTIRLKRVGAKQEASYRIIVTDSREGTSGQSIERLGIYNPRTRPSIIRVNAARTLHWLHEGAEPSDTVRSLLQKTGVWKQFHDGVTAEQAEQEVVFLGPAEGDRHTSQRPMPTDRTAKPAAGPAAAAPAAKPAEPVAEAEATEAEAEPAPEAEAAEEVPAAAAPVEEAPAAEAEVPATEAEEAEAAPEEAAEPVAEAEAAVEEAEEAVEEAAAEAVAEVEVVAEAEDTPADEAEETTDEAEAEEEEK